MADARSAPGKRRSAQRAPERATTEDDAPRRSFPWRRVAGALAALLLLAGAVFALRAPFGRWQTGRHFASAQRMLASGQDAAAAAELAVVLRRDPAHRQARLALADLELRRGRTEHAFLHLVSYTDLVPEDVEGWMRLADVQARSGQAIEEEVALTRALEIEPGRDRLRGRRAGVRLRLGKLRSALADATIAVEADARDVEAWIVLCRAVLSMRGRAQADEAIRRAIAAAGPDRRLLDLAGEPPAQAPPDGPPAGHTGNWPGDLGAIARQFLASMRARDANGVASVVRSARERYPGTFLAPWLGGVAALAEGKMEEAERELLEALASSPRSHRVVTNLIGLWSRQHGPSYTGDRLVALVERDPLFTYPLPIAAHAYLEDAQPAKAEATVRRLFALLPSSPVPFRETAEFFLAVDRASDAIATAEDGLRRFPGDAGLHVLLARSALLLGDRERALAFWEDALKARPDDQRAAAQLARLLATARKDDASRARALQLVHELELDQPRDADVLTAMGTVLLGPGGDPRRARNWLLLARQAAPEDPSVRYQLAVAYVRSGETSLARTELTEALRSGRAFAEEAEARKLERELAAR